MGLGTRRHWPVGAASWDRLSHSGEKPRTRQPEQEGWLPARLSRGLCFWFMEGPCLSTRVWVTHLLQNLSCTFISKSFDKSFLPPTEIQPLRILTISVLRALSHCGSQSAHQQWTRASGSWHLFRTLKLMTDPRLLDGE